MKATNKQEFFDLLGAELRRIGIEDTNDIFADFEEHFTDGAMQGIPEDVTAERLGDIKEIARSYLNLESSRINSIMARDIEHRKVSLTKPGRGVPADLSLIGSGSAKEAVNSDNIREYTPEHFSSEIFPQSPNSVGGANTSAGAGMYSGSSMGAGVGMGANMSSGTYSGANSYSGSAAGMGMGAGMAAGAGVSGANGMGAGLSANAGTADKTVAGAFSDAGRAALDAAKLTGQVVADAFKQRGSEVKDAMTNAGKTAADAVKAAGDAVQRTVKSRTKPNKSGYNGTAPRPSDTYRRNMNTANGNSYSSRRADIPPQHTKTKTNGGYKVIDFSSLTPNVNAGKLVLAILLDCFLWIWLLPAIIGGIFGIIFGGGIGSIAGAFEAFFGYEFGYHIFISRLFLGFGFFWLGIAAVCVGVFFIRLFIKLIKFIINLHIKAIYDL